jgi:hypothetical protein
MKIIRKTRSGERREALLKEYFLTASWIALLRKVAVQAASAVEPAPRGRLQPLPVRVRR